MAVKNILKKLSSRTLNPLIALYLWKKTTYSEKVNPLNIFFLQYSYLGRTKSIDLLYNNFGVISTTHNFVEKPLDRPSILYSNSKYPLSFHDLVQFTQKYLLKPRLTVFVAR